MFPLAMTIVVVTYYWPTKCVSWVAESPANPRGSLWTETISWLLPDHWTQGTNTWQLCDDTTDRNSWLIRRAEGHTLSLTADCDVTSCHAYCTPVGSRTQLNCTYFEVRCLFSLHQSGCFLFYLRKKWDLKFHYY